MDKKLKSLWQQQIANELHSSELYMAVASHFDQCGFENLSGFFYGHAKEERSHADYLMEYLMKSGNFPTEIPAIPVVSTQFKSCTAAMELVASLEELVTSQINGIASAAASVNDHAAYSSIQHLVDEQVEELDWSSKLLMNIRSAEATNTLHLFDHNYSS